MPEIKVLGYVVPKPRPRFGEGKKPFTPRTAELAEEQIRKAWVALADTDGRVVYHCPVYAYVMVRVPRPVGHFGSGRNKARLLPSAPRWPAVRPDLDNYAKTALDALRGVAYVDDGQIVRAYLSKGYCQDDEPAGWRIGVFPMEDSDD